MLKTLRGKIALGYLLLATLLIAVSILSASNINRLTGAIDKIMAENYRSVTAAERMIMAVERQDSSVLLYIHGLQDDMISDFHHAQNTFLKWLSRAEDNITLANEADVVNRISGEYTQYVAAFSELRLVDSRASQLDFYLNNMLPLLRSIEEEVELLLSMNHDSMLEARAFADNLGRRATLSTLATGLVALLLAAGASFYMSQLIIRPTKELTELLQNIEPGNVGNLAAAEQPDELGALAREVNLMIARLREYDERIISQLQSQERRSRAIVESIADGIVVVDGDYSLLMVNQTARNIFDMSPNTVSGHLLERIDDDRVFQAIKESMDESKTIELRGPEKAWLTEGERGRRYYELAVSPVSAEDGKVIGAVANFRDVTHYHEVEELKTDFISTVTHEFKTPLTSLSLNASLLSEQVEEHDTDLAQYEELPLIAQEIKEDSERLLELIEDLLDLSRLESEQITMETEPVDVDELVQHALQPFWRQAEEKGVDLQVDELENLPTVIADPTKIAWVITNLVGNAIRYAGEQGTIRVSAREMGTRVSISVADDGPGIPEEMQERIFEKFVRAPSGKHEDPGGSGLGLAISKQIVQAHGERIWVESKADEGSRFTFTLSKTKQATAARSDNTEEGR